MAVFKCKMCGATLEVQPDEKICECEYCGTVQTIPSVNEEYLQNLFNRANNLRMKAEFDKAADTYERIIQEDTTEAEAYWGLVLCKYGIEYVEDPATHKRIPTCHRTSYDAVTADEDYCNAIKYADISQKSIYESEAKEIDEVQKRILAVAATESDYDVFICYKEADEEGKRTVDSAIANDIYYELTQEGFKVFYSAITLEDKLGSEYEPYIFSALNSAKVMLVVGTKPEYFNAVWVKNEWSRFLKLMQNDRSRTLIPCYRDMDAYDLPEEFAHLQAEDMSKIGFMSDIIRGIKKLITNLEGPSTTSTSINMSGAKPKNPGDVNIEALLERAFMFLEDGEWKRADDFCEQVLNNDPKNVRAYVGKLMAELRVNQQKDLANLRTPFDTNNNYKKILRFGGDDIKKELENDNRIIEERNRKEQLDFQYKNAVLKYDRAITEDDFKEAAESFEAISNWRDAAEKVKIAREKAENARLDGIYNEAVQKYNNAALKYNNSAKERDFIKAAELFETISDWKDAGERAKISREKAEEARKDYIYLMATAKENSSDVFTLKDCITNLESISGWKDSDEKIIECKNRIAELERYQEDERERQEKEKKKRKKRWELVFIICAVIACIVIVILIVNRYNLNRKLEQEYDQATGLIEEGKIVNAMLLLNELVDYDYKDSKDLVDNFVAEDARLIGLVADKVGDEVLFGNYEQDNDKGNGPERIEWIVVNITDARIMLLSKYVLDVDSGSYFSDTLEKFKEEAFDMEEQSILQDIRLLDWDEITEFNLTSNFLITDFTEYALSKDPAYHSDSDGFGNAWWLEDGYIVMAGTGKTNGQGSSNEINGIRPLIVMSKSSLF